MKVIIAGINELSTVLHRSLKKEGIHEVCAFTVDKQYIKEDTIEGLPVIDFEELSSHYKMDEYEIALTLGYKKMNDVRKSFYGRCKEKGYRLFTYISPSAIVYSDDIGEGSLIYPGAYVGPYVKLGHANIVHMMVCISHHINIGDFNFFAGGSMIGGDVAIGSNCFIGMQNTIKNGISIGDRVLVGAKNFISHDLESGYAYTGNEDVDNKKIKSDLMCKFI